MQRSSGFKLSRPATPADGRLYILAELGDQSFLLREPSSGSHATIHRHLKN